jgi:flagellar basal body rod protein FlgC
MKLMRTIISQNISDSQKKSILYATGNRNKILSMSMVALLLLAFPTSSHATQVPCDKPLHQIELQMKVAADNLAIANQAALPGMWPQPVETVKCQGEKCKVDAHQGVRLSYEPYSFYADDLGLVGYPDVDPQQESIKLASLQWEYDLQKQSCEQ